MIAKLKNNFFTLCIDIILQICNEMHAWFGQFWHYLFIGLLFPSLDDKCLQIGGNASSPVPGYLQQWLGLYSCASFTNLIKVLSAFRYTQADVSPTSNLNLFVPF